MSDVMFALIMAHIWLAASIDSVLVKYLFGVFWLVVAVFLKVFA